MENKTSVYILSIVGMVALVAVVYMLAGSVGQGANTDYGNAITGNVVDEDIAPINLSGFGRFILAAGLIGACVFLYRTVE